MRTKQLFLCMLFLLIGTSAAWADKYYRVVKRAKTVEIGTGKKYMIFNTAFYGTQNRSGFLYNMGTTFGLKRFTSVDKYLCGEAFVFELENAGDEDPHTFYLKSTASGGYMNLDGQQSVTPTVLNLYTWDEARAGDEYTVTTSGVTINEKNNIKQACVKSYNSGYTVITENNITSESNAVYVIANENNTWYFNGNVDSYATWTDGHPYAFYECVEATGAETFDISELHIYSRADFYSAQQMYGYITDASQITSYPLYNDKPYEGEGAIANLIDGNYKSYNVTNWHNNSVTHYYQIDLETSVESLRLYMASRSDKKNAPVVYELWATNDPAGEWTKIDLGENNKTTLKDNLVYISPIINLGASYRYIRIQAPDGRSSAEQCLALSELYVLPNREEINTAIAYFDHTLPAAGTEAVYKAIIDERNANPVASAVKLFSGVPVPGNKYRIYADAYSDGVYVNRHISINTDGEYKLAANGDYYNAGDEQEAFEWYCEESSDGKLIFRNVKYPTYYLSNSTVTTNIGDAGWEMETSNTQHQGVPLKNGHGQYLAVSNDGSYWMGDVKKPMNQKVTTGKLDIKNTADNTDDIDANGGLCTDFVFIPVDLDADEVRLTITASELADRNSALSVGGTVYELPFSRVFYNGVPEITVTSTAGDFHEPAGFYKNGVFIGNTIDNTLFTNSTLKGGDVVEVRFRVNKLPSVSTADNIILYQIKNRRAKSAPQNAGMSRVGLDYGDEGDEFISMENGNYNYYASFNAKNQPIDLLYKESDIKANSFFYFTNDEAQVGENYMVYINSAITTFRCNKPNEWTAGGSLHYIQPNAVGGDTYGFAITHTKLDGSNNPYSGWNAHYGEAGATAIEYYVEDENSAWEFVQVDAAVATEKLTLYIKETAADMIVDLTGKLDTPGFDNVKINHTIGVIEAIAGEYNEADGTFSGGNIIGATVTSLVGYAQELHMLHHEAEYAMLALPEPTNENETDFQPAWYYVKNVNTGYYARYQGADNLMTLTAEIGNNKLPHLFYFAGEKINTGTKDEYLAAHIHNFMALNLKDATKDSTIVSYNRELLTTDVAPNGDGSQTKISLSEAQQLKNSEAWRLELDFDLASGAFFNGWGSGLLAAGGNGTATQDGGTYENGFQVYLQNDGDVVIRGGDSGANDGYIFNHTVGKYSKLKVVLTYANYRLQVAVTNSEGVTQTIKDTPTGISKNRDYIPCGSMKNVTEMASAMAGASSFKLKAEVVLAMKWDTHENNEAVGENGDKWYILPSSNTEFPGLAIVTDGPDDTNMGWSNVNGENKEIFTGPGVDDFSTWQLEKVEAYEVHIDEILDLYDIDDCIIYNKRLVELYNAIQEIVDSGRDDEEIFNDLFNLIRNYDGPSPAELRAPKPGKFYTIYPASNVEEVEMCVHVDKTADEISTNEVNRTTKIVTYNGDDNVEHDEYNSRGVWFFEGTADGDGFLPTTGIQLNNLHTQTQLNALDASGALLTEEGALNVTLAKNGGAKVAIQAGGNNMARGDVASRSIINASTTRTFATDKATITFDWEQLNTHVNGNTGEISKDDINTAVVKTDKGSVAFSTSHSIMARLSDEEQIGYNTICTFANANTSPTIEHTFTLSDLGDSFTFNHIALDIHAFNGARKYQANSDNVLRQWNINAQVSDGNGEFTDFFTLADIDIAAGVGTAGNVHQKWGLAGNEFTTTTGKLVVKLTITKGTNNSGCFFGLSEVALSNVGDVWYIEEIEKPEYIYHQTNTSVAGHSTLMLGFPTKIPSDVVAFRGRGEGIVVESRYISLISYDDVLPAMAPVILRNADKSIESKNVKFYYTDSEAEVVDDKYIYGALYYTIVDCSSFDNVFPGDVDIYMLNKNKTTTRMYRTYENYNAEGEKVTIDGTTNHFEGGHIPCKANKAFMILAKDEGGSQSSFSLRFGGDETTDIENIESEECVLEVIETIYDLQGRKLDEITEPGIYIINGKKVFIK